MKKLALALLLLSGTPAFGQMTSPTPSPAELVPPGLVVVETIRGDLNKDGQEDTVLIIQGTDKANFVQHEYRGELDLNRRGIVIAFKTGDRYERALINQNAFASENEDGGVYFAPELDVSIKNGVLQFHYFHGRYGFWRYKFRYQNNDFELIGYDSSSNRGPVTLSTLSINFLTQRMQIRENLNEDAEPDEAEEFTETWKSIQLPQPLRLRDVDFDRFEIGRCLNNQNPVITLDLCQLPE